MDWGDIASIVIGIFGFFGLIVPLAKALKETGDIPIAGGSLIHTFTDALEPDDNGKVTIDYEEIEDIVAAYETLVDELDDVKPAWIKVWKAIIGIFKNE